MLADDVCVVDGWLKLLVLKVGVRGGELFGRLFPVDEPFLEFFLGELCWKKIKANILAIVLFTVFIKYTVVKHRQVTRIKKIVGNIVGNCIKVLRL